MIKRINFEYFDWSNIWYWVRLPILVILLMALGWLVSGCGPKYPFTPVPIPSVSQALIDREVERVNLMNEAFRKLTGMGCTRETIIETDAYVDSHNVDSYYEYECETNGGLWLKLRKFKDRWVIHGE